MAVTNNNATRKPKKLAGAPDLSAGVKDKRKKNRGRSREGMVIELGFRVAPPSKKLTSRCCCCCWCRRRMALPSRRAQSSSGGCRGRNSSSSHPEQLLQLILYHCFS